MVVQLRWGRGEGRGVCCGGSGEEREIVLVVKQERRAQGQEEEGVLGGGAVMVVQREGDQLSWWSKGCKGKLVWCSEGVRGRGGRKGLQCWSWVGGGKEVVRNSTCTM